MLICISNSTEVALETSTAVWHGKEECSFVLIVQSCQHTKI